MKNLLNIFIIIIISAVTGAAVSISVSFIEHDNLISGMLRGAAAGALIGFAARFAFTSIYLHFRQRPLPAYLAMTGTVGAGTFTGCLITDVTLMPAGLIAVIVSIGIAVILTTVIFHYSKKLNNVLEEKKNSLSNNKDS